MGGNSQLLANTVLQMSGLSPCKAIGDNFSEGDNFEVDRCDIPVKALNFVPGSSHGPAGILSAEVLWEISWNASHHGTHISNGVVTHLAELLKGNCGVFK